MRSISLLAAIVLLCACATPNQVNEDFAFEPGGNDAVVVVSTGVKDECGGSVNTVTVGYEGLTAEGRSPGGFLLTNPMLTHDFENPPGFFHVRRFPAGEYRLTYFSKTSMRGSFRSKKDMDSVFRLEPGKIYYLGEMLVTIPADCKSYRITFNDRRGRDGPLFDKRMKNLRFASAQHIPIKGTRPIQ